MNRKVENMIDLAYYKSVNICNAFVQKWRDNKPENEELKEFAIKYDKALQQDLAKRKEMAEAKIVKDWKKRQLQYKAGIIK